MKYIFFFICVLNVSIVFSQSQSQLLEYYNSLKASGFSDTQIKSLAKENGYDISELLKNQKESPSKGMIPLSDSEQKNTDYTNFSTPTTNQDILEQTPKVFGQHYFENLEFNFTPQINIATPSNYQLGPSDGITISLWGASEMTYRLELDRSGRIIIDGVGPIYLNGYTLLGAKSKIKKSLSSIYSGLYSNQPEQVVNIDLSLNSTRSVFVSMVGQVKAPGIYTLNGMSSVIHALYAAGGITENGSYRTIEVLRGGKVLKVIDLYDYFVNGTLPVLFLKDQDVIKVPYYKDRTLLEGEVKFSGYFELNPKESVQDLLNYSGGLSPFARKDQFLISRIEKAKYKTFNTNELNTPLESGDKVFIYSIASEEDQTVYISGEVLTPGKYSIGSIKTIADLISISNGFTKVAYLEYGTLFRKQKNSSPQMISVGLDSKKYDLNLSEPLMDQDSIVIFNKERFLPLQTIRVIGQVNKPGKIDFYNKMSLQDAVALAEGIKTDKSRIKIIIESVAENQNDYITTQTINSFDSNILSRVFLKPFDVISVIEKNNVNPITLELKGAFNDQGFYLQSQKSNKIKDLIEKAGGLNEFADSKSLYIKRKVQSNTASIINDSLIDQTEVSAKEQDFIYIPINSIEESYFFQDGDQFIAEKYSNEIRLSGEVLKPSVVKYKSPNARYYLSKSGISASGSKKDIYVIYPNKDVKATKSFLFFKSYPKILPGSELVVGKKPERAKLTSQEVLGISSGLSTLIIVLSTLLSGQ